MASAAMLRSALRNLPSGPLRSVTDLRRCLYTSSSTSVPLNSRTLAAFGRWLNHGPAASKRTFMGFGSRGGNSGMHNMKRLERMEQDAMMHRGDADKQSTFMAELNRFDPELTIRHYEGLRDTNGAVNESVMKEYLKALVRTEKIDKAELAGPLLNRGGAAMQQGGGAPLMQGGKPFRVELAEPSMGTQIWRTIRVLAVVLLLTSGIGVLLDERVLSRGGSGHQEYKHSKQDNKTFDDVKGVDEAKQELEQIVMFLRDPDQFTRLGGKLPRGVLLMGPPGTGKTLLARSISGEAGVPFFYASGSEFEEMYVGVGARRVRDLFAAAKKKAPCIIFIDEIDAIGGTRNLKDQQAMKMTLNQLLVEMDGFQQNEGIIVIGATNFPDVLDKALVRPGRFDQHVAVPLPDVEGRRQIAEHYMKKVTASNEVNCDTVARGTPGFSGADIANLVNVAALHASSLAKDAVTMHDIEFARDKIMMGSERKSAVISEESRKLTAFHEAGHALVALYTAGSDPIHKATIMPRGMALGMVQQLPEGDQTSYARRQMLARLDVCMGGRIAEEMVFGSDLVTSGASSDIRQATDLAESMVTKWGMSDRVGPVAHNRSSMEVMSPETRTIIEQEVRALLETAASNARKLLESRKKELHNLANALIQHETLTGDEVKLAAKGKKIVKNASTFVSKKEGEGRAMAAKKALEKAVPVPAKES